MGTVANTVGFRSASFGPPESDGTGKRITIAIAQLTLSNSYATNGDTVSVPTQWGDLKALIVCAPFKSITDIVCWNDDVSTPKLKVFAETAGTLAEVANASDQSAKSRYVIGIFSK